MHGWVDQGAHAVRDALGMILAPWGGPEAAIDAYEAAVRHVVVAQQDLARSLPVPPVRSLVAVIAEVTRDVGAVQTSAARWVLAP